MHSIHFLLARIGYLTPTSRLRVPALELPYSSIRRPRVPALELPLVVFAVVLPAFVIVVVVEFFGGCIYC